MKIYIAGPMTGYEQWNFPAFFEAEKKLIELGHEVVNPAHNDGPTLEEALASAGTAEAPNHTWGYYMRRDLPSVLSVDAICVLPGWRHSKGASLEVTVGESLGLDILCIKDGHLVPRVNIVGLSGWARSGKDTLADVLVEKHGYEKLSIASPMRDALYKLNPRVVANGVAGTALRTVIDVYGWETAKEVAPEVRELLQRFGTEVGREMFGENFWVDYAMSQIPDGSKVVIADIRFPNEAEAIKKLGGKVFRLERPGVKAANDHISEHALNDYSFDGHINNDSDIEDLQKRAGSITNVL